MAAHPGAPFLGPSIAVNALIDTGATTTGITSRLATQLHLQPIGKVPIHGVGGVQIHNSYLFMVGFPFALPPGAPPAQGLPPPAPGEMQAQVHVLQKVIQGCEFHGGAANFEVILGMDVISTGSLVVQGNRTFSFSF
ncbi:MAG: aspartyl protease family protein [Alphaproteobacteria bacterium]